MIQIRKAQLFGAMPEFLFVWEDNVYDIVANEENLDSINVLKGWHSDNQLMSVEAPDILSLYEQLNCERGELKSILQENINENSSIAIRTLQKIEGRLFKQAEWLQQNMKSTIKKELRDQLQKEEWKESNNLKYVSLMDLETLLSLVKTKDERVNKAYLDLTKIRQSVYMTKVNELFADYTFAYLIIKNERDAKITDSRSLLEDELKELKEFLEGNINDDNSEAKNMNPQFIAELNNMLLET